jgi:hypothetical protein
MKNTGPPESSQISKASSGSSQLKTQKITRIDTQRSKNRFIQ